MFGSLLLSVLLASSALAAPRSSRPLKARYAGLKGRSAPLQARNNYVNEPWKLTDLGVTCRKAADEYGSSQNKNPWTCDLSFNWTDPNTVSAGIVSSGSCNGNWTWDGNTNGTTSIDFGSFIPCWETFSQANITTGVNTTDTNVTLSDYFMLGFKNFTSPGDFTLNLAHDFFLTDDPAFPYPYNRLETFVFDLNINMSLSNVEPSPPGDPNFMQYLNSGDITVRVNGEAS